MAANSSAHPARAGFNQSGGAYFICVTALEPTAGTAAFVNTLTAAASGSGGAFAPPTLALTTMSNVLGTGAGITNSNASTIVGASKLIKDMGKTVVSGGRVFRKFAPVVGNATTNSSFGVVGAGGTAPNTGYGSFYLEVGREGQGTATPAPIARYF